INLSDLKSLEPQELEKKYKKDKPDLSVTAALATLPLSIFQDKYDPKTGKRIEKRWGFATDKEPVDPWIVNAVSKPFEKIGKFLGTNKSIKEDIERKERKIDENITRIKQLLK
ncbi:hypothetical protein EBU94_05655, partial [bacterium]|nr:hypothetical protein [bacterium]